MKKGAKGVSIIDNKIRLVAELKDKFAKSKLAILTNFSGLNVAQITELRRRLGGASAEIKIVKNNLAKIASKETPFEVLYGFFSGPTSITFGWQDVVEPAKVLIEFAKKQPNLEVKAAILGGKLLSPNQVQQLAYLPPREVLLAQALSGMQAPVVAFAGALGGILRNLLLVLQAIKEKRAIAETAGA